jgi:hypothetical protein
MGLVSGHSIEGMECRPSSVSTIPGVDASTQTLWCLLSSCLWGGDQTFTGQMHVVLAGR